MAENRWLLLDVGGVLCQVDDRPDNVEAAERLGMHALLHRETPTTVAAVRALLPGG